MLRRDFVRAVVAAGLAPQALLAQQANQQPQLPLPAPVPWPTGFNPQTPVPHTAGPDSVAETDALFFSAAQMATLSRLCDVLMPPVGKKPGALQAKTPLFLDFLIASSAPAKQRLYVGGLEWLNEEAARRYKLPFAGLNAAQADAILQPWLRTWMSDHPPLEPHANFVNLAHSEIRTATVNSREWSEAPSAGAQEKTAAGLYWEPIEPNFGGNPAPRRALPAHVTVGATPTRAMPEYSR
jgi:Gluconate 2-dehydrogenase subunit 3